MSVRSDMKILVTGATGYIGGRLVPRLLEAGHTVRIGVRDPGRIGDRPWSDQVETVRLDVTEPDTIGPALEGVDAAYYLIHSMQDTADFEARDRVAAEAFGAAAAAAGVRHVVYLGGLQPSVPKDTPISAHLRSRAEVGQELARHVPTTEFRAGPIIGSGSASFEMTRYLTERLPAMVAPKWIQTEVSPVAVRDVLAYLVAALEVGPSGIVDIGTDPLPFREMMQGYARARGLPRRLILRVPVLTPQLAGLWVELVTPIPNRIAVPIIKGIIHPLRADTTKARHLFPVIDPLPYDEAVRRALDKIDERVLESRWSDALGDLPDHRLVTEEGLIKETQVLDTETTPRQVFRAAASLGGAQGWPVDGLWRIRGGVDRLVGGPGSRRGRRHPTELRVGDALDFWRVEAIERDRRILLRAEMKVPGRAWLQWEMVPRGAGTRLVQTAFFSPHGAAGVAYWYVLYPVHRAIFRTMARRLADTTDPDPA